MSKRKSARRSNKYTETFTPVAHVDGTGAGDETVDVVMRRYVMVESPRTKEPIELNAWEARRLGRALLEAADRLDGAR